MVIHPNEPVSHDVSRASVIADLIRAQHSLPYDPDLAALYLDGALRSLLALVAIQPGNNALPDVQSLLALDHQSLLALDHQRPHIARRMRLALRAPHAEARLAHCWALLDLLNADAAHAGSARVMKG